jgi:CHASE2 domain-containing sensor protein
MNRPDLLVRIVTIIALLIAIVLFLFQGWSTPTFVFAVITVILSFIYQLIRLQIKKR